MAMTEDEIRGLLGTLPPGRRLQARAAVTGSVGDLIDLLRRISDVAAAEPGSHSIAYRRWQATLSTLYIVGVAAGRRPQEEVAEIIKELGTAYCAGAALDAAAARPPGALAAIAGVLPDNAEFLGKVTARRQPEDLAVMLSVMRESVLLMSSAVRQLCTAAPPHKVATVVLHLRGVQALEPLGEVLAGMLRQPPGTALAAFLASLDRFGDDESVHAVIDTMLASVEIQLATQAEALADAFADADNVVERIAELVKSLLQESQEGFGQQHEEKKKQENLAKLVVSSAIRKFTPSGQQYRLYALVFVFTELDLDDVAMRIMDEITATVPDNDITQTIIKYCLDQPQHAGPLMQLVLQTPRPGVTADAATEFAVSVRQAREVIYATVAAQQPFPYLVEFEKGLRATAFPMAEEFRDIVKERSSARRAGEEIGDIIDWFLRDADAARGRNRADYVIAEVAQRLEPALLVPLICELRDNKQWWRRPQRRGVRWERTLRDYAALCVGEQYQIEHMLAMITAAKRRCLPAVLRLVPDWLSRRQPVGGEVVRLVKALKEARCDDDELIAAIEWSASESRWLDDPSPALDAAGLTDAAAAWRRGKRHRPRRPDPDPQM
jgi:hypothetical protein